MAEQAPVSAGAADSDEPALQAAVTERLAQVVDAGTRPLRKLFEELAANATLLRISATTAAFGSRAVIAGLGRQRAALAALATTIEERMCE
jgi:hypothetical protein